MQRFILRVVTLIGVKPLEQVIVLSHKVHVCGRVASRRPFLFSDNLFIVLQQLACFILCGRICLSPVVRLVILA